MLALKMEKRGHKTRYGMWPLEVGKGKETNSPARTQPCYTFILAQ